MKTFLKNKKVMAGFLAFALLLSGVVGVLGFDKVIAYAIGVEVKENGDYGKFDTYYEIEFVDNTSGEVFSGANYGNQTNKTGEDLAFTFYLSRNFKLEDQTVIDSYRKNFTNGDMEKLNSLDHLRYRTREVYPYYKTPNIELASFVAITNTELTQDYYIGDISIKQTTKNVNGENTNVFVLSTPILKLNRNVEKTKVNYEGELTEETKAEIINRVKEANPNMNNERAVTIEGDKLVIETWNRYHTGTPYLAFNVEDLITRVADAGTQTDNLETNDQATQTKVEVLVKYVFEDGKVYKEDKVNADIGSVLDSGDLPILPEDMKFTDDFLFYEVKESDNVIERKVAQLTEDKEVQTEDPETDEASTQTEITQEDITKLEEKSEELGKEVEKLKEDLEKSEEISKEQKEKIEALEKEKADLEQEFEEAKKLSEEANKKEESDENKACLEQVKAIEEKLEGIDKTLQETNKIIKENKSSSNSANQTQTKETSQPVKTQQTDPVQQILTTKTDMQGVKTTENQISDKSNSSVVNSSNDDNKEDVTQSSNQNDGKTTSLVSKEKEKETEIRYPNKLTPKQAENSTSYDMNGNNQPVNTNKGVASDPSKARGTVTENVDNANNEFPVHHGTAEEANKACEDLPYYSADARQFVTFTTKSGKTFHLIINHDEDSENVMLLTEVSEDDLLNMVETKEEPVKDEPVKIEEPEPVVEEPVKQEEPSNAGTYLLVGLVIAGVLGAGYYLKVVKARENDELAGFEEDDDDYYYSEAEDDYIDSNEDEYVDDEEEDIDSEDLL